LFARGNQLHLAVAERGPDQLDDGVARKLLVGLATLLRAMPVKRGGICGDGVKFSVLRRLRDFLNGLGDRAARRKGKGENSGRGQGESRGIHSQI
jgi:hypothetical protein